MDFDYYTGDHGSIPTHGNSLGKWMNLSPGQPMPYEGNWVVSPRYWWNIVTTYIYCTVKRINGSKESVVLCVYFVYLSCVIVYKMLFTRWLFTGLTNGRCKRLYDGELLFTFHLLLLVSHPLPLVSHPLPIVSHHYHQLP